MSEEETELTGKSKGGQVGNQNARKHGFYSNVLDEKEQEEYEKAIMVEGFDDEIAMLRVKIMSLLEKDPENVRLITQAINSLVKMISIKYQIEGSDGTGLLDAVRNVLKTYAIPFGVTIGSRLLK